MTKTHRIKCMAILTAIIYSMAVPYIMAVTTTWDGSDGNWNDDANWDEGVPGTGDTAIINAGSVLITNSSLDLAKLTMNGGTLTFTNWSTRLSADAIEILGSSKVTLPPPYQDGQMSNRVWFACETFELGENAQIDAGQKGYQRGSSGGTEELRKGHGPGALAGSNNPGPAASHGGHGARRLVDSVYGLAEAPIYPGSGGSGSSWATGGHGGGAVLIEATDNVIIDGTITADAGDSGIRAGGGSGGSIFITCRTITGNGLLSAAGGQSNYSDNGLGGGGGRIAVLYNTTDQATLPVPGLRFWVHAGTVITEGEPGTLYFPDTRFLEKDVWTYRGRWINDGLNEYGIDTLTISNGWVRFPNDGFKLVVTNSLTLLGDGSVSPSYGWQYRNAGRLDLIGGHLVVGGNFFATNTATFSVFQGATTADVAVGGDFRMSAAALTTIHAIPTNGIGPEYGARLVVTGLLATASDSWLVPISHWTNGGSVFMWAGDVFFDDASGINANHQGWGNDPATYSTVNYGPGKGGYPMGGAGYGGRGGTALGGSVYGTAQNPREPGSAGADQAGNGGYGGGLVRLTVEGGVTINGTITANGQDGGFLSGNRRAGGGSGGGIYIACAWIGGTNGVVSADGGLGHNSTHASGGGGGGRIAVHYIPAQQDAIPLPTIQFSALGGRGIGSTFINRDDIDGDLGTLYFTDSRFLTEPINHSGVWLAPGLADWDVAQMSVVDRWIRFPDPEYTVTVAGDVTIADNGRLDLVNGTLMCGGGMTLTNRGTMAFLSMDLDEPINSLDVGGNLALWDKSYLNVHAAPTNAINDYGARVDVGGTLRLEEHCWIWPFSNPTNVGSARFYVDQIQVATNAGFNADGLGGAGAPPILADGFGIGGGRIDGNIRGGGGYGGIGGVPENNSGGIEYGSKELPTDAGSGGAGTSSGTSNGGAGGGLIWIYANRHAEINGQLLANGRNPGIYGGGGSGGGIYLRCLRLSGNFYLSAFGGNGGTHSVHGGGSGAGGRIAIWRAIDESTFTYNILAGTSHLDRVGEDGTFYLGNVAMPGTLIMIR